MSELLTPRSYEIHRESPFYPLNLAGIPARINTPEGIVEINRPPETLFVKGTINFDRPNGEELYGIAVVGSRMATEIGLNMANEVAKALASQKQTVISGLALGIDTAAHLGALAADGKTVAVIPTALNKIYPPANINLAEAVSRKGALVSEYDEKDYTCDPIARNRIIVGLSPEALIMIEGAAKGGTRRTVQIAYGSGRTIYYYQHPNTAHRNAYLANTFTNLADPRIIGFQTTDQLLDLLFKQT